MKKIELHTHTVSTVSYYDFEFSLIKLKEYVEKLEIDALAITNHNTFNMSQYYEINNSLSIPVFPGIEIDLEGGHLLLITETDDFEIINFDEKCKKVSSLGCTTKFPKSKKFFYLVYPNPQGAKKKNFLEVPQI